MPPRPNPEMPVPSNRSLFPIATEAWKRNIDAFSPFNDARLRLVIAGNAALLPANDPIRHLATLAERPQLAVSRWDPEQQRMRETLASGYIAGVCLGAAIWRDHVGMLKEQGITVPAAKVEPDTTYLVPPPLPRGARIFRRLVRPLVDLTSLEHEYEVHTTLPRFLAAADSEAEMFQDEKLWLTLTNLMQLHANWRHNGVAFMGDPHARQDVRDYMRLGIGDVFRLHAVLNGELVEKVEHSIEYSPRRHFFPPGPTPHDLLSPDAQPMQIKFDQAGWEDPHKLRDHLETITSTRRQGGWGGLTFKGKLGKKTSTAWNTEVAIATRVESVSHFDSRYVLPSDSDGQHLRLVGDEWSIREYALHENDALVVREASGRVSALYHPFLLSPTDKKNPTALPAEILGLCRLRIRPIIGRE